MRHLHFLFLILVLNPVACKKEKKTGNAKATLMKSESVEASLAMNSGSALTSSGSMAQSFTPDSLKIPIFAVSLCLDSSSCRSLYKCDSSSVDDCAVELSDLDAFVDTLNASPTELEEGSTFDHIGVQFCADGDSSGIQHITVNGTVTIQGTEYGTDPDSGLIAGTTGKDTVIDVSGGCASYYPIEPNVTISEKTTVEVKLFFDASLSVYGGVEGGDSTLRSYNDTGGCAGTEGAFVCAPVVTVVPTIATGDPSVEHYLLSNIDASDDATPTAKAVLYFAEDDTPIGGVQNTYRLSGSSISWGKQMGGGLGLYPKTVDDNTVSFGEPEGSISLANWFKEFKRETHTGTYIYDVNGNETEGSYKATKL